MRAIGYLRVSTKRQDYDAQRAALEGRFPITEWIGDKGTGRKVQANLRKLLRELKAGDAVYVYAFDRLGRDTEDVISLSKHFAKAGVSLISARELCDLKTPMGRFQLGILANVAQFESEIISDRIHQGLKAARKRAEEEGRTLRLGRPPIDPNILATARQLRASGHKLKSISHHLGVSIGALSEHLRSVV